MNTCWWRLCAVLDTCESADLLSRSGLAFVALSLLFAACQTPPVHGSTRSLDDASVGLDASGSPTDFDARKWTVDAFAESQPDVATERGALEFTVPWRRQEVLLEPDGRSALLTFALEQQERPVFALRTYAPDASATGPLCFQLEEVSADATTWVPRATSADHGDYCTNCEQRVAVGKGYGFFTLPSAAQVLPTIQTLALRVALRDCLTLTPLADDVPRPRTLVVESTSYATPAADLTLVLPLLIVEATPHTFSDGARLDQAFARIQEIWRSAGIELVLRGPLALPRPAAPVKYDTTDRASLSTLARDVRELAQRANVEPVAPWIVLTPCLLREDSVAPGMSQPTATTTHLPGGFAVHDEPDGIFVAGERCGGLTPGARYLESETLASVMAHELGHFLGLFHVREPDGREDTLADTDASTPNLMQVRPSAAATTLTETQISIARRHLALAVANARRQKQSRN